MAVGLGPRLVMHLKDIVPPILSNFQDHDSRVRYYACEAMYNVAKVARGAILAWFNEIFDALTKLSVDVELTVKTAAELLDRLMKDIVSERATYCPPTFELDEKSESNYSPVPGTTNYPGGPLAFNVPRFIPLLVLLAYNNRLNESMLLAHQEDYSLSSGFTS